jgi:UDP-N-acetylmuramoylalanine--D-glutamate ligase
MPTEATAAGGVPHDALVIGLAVTGRAVTRRLLQRGHAVVVADDRPGPVAYSAAAQLGVPLVATPTTDELDALVRRTGVVLPSPGVPAHHPVFELAARARVPVWSEFELAARWSDLPVVAVTGTNGKTTVTTLVADMLARAGRRVATAGNTDVPLVDVLDEGLDVVVVEASSFRLALTDSFQPSVAAWLNVAEDHLDWHRSAAEYVAAKAKVWANLRVDDVAVANADDAIVSAAARGLARVRWFSVETKSDWWWDRDHGRLVGPDGAFVDVDALPRRLPHDLANALAASACASEAGADAVVCATSLREFAGLRHRVALVGEAGGVRWYDDSKATTPASVLAAVRGFDSVVLIAGGRNKGLDLTVLAAGVPPVRGVVAVGEAGPDVAAAFATTGVPTVAASSMADAVDAAGDLARPGDAVLLSPGCASFDWYRDYTERGDDFARIVLARPGMAPGPELPEGSH